MKLLSSCYYHPRSSSVITDRNILDADTVSGLQNLLPKDEKYGLKFVAVCLEDGLAGRLDRDSLVEALEIFGQIRDSGVAPHDILRELKEKSAKLAPVVRARQLIEQNKKAASMTRMRKSAKRPKRTNHRAVRR